MQDSHLNGCHHLLLEVAEHSPHGGAHSGDGAEGAESGQKEELLAHLLPAGEGQKDRQCQLGETAAGVPSTALAPLILGQGQ